MKTIKKAFKTMKQAERYQQALYNKYNKVELVSFPLYWESGFYIWQVA